MNFKVDNIGEYLKECRKRKDLTLNAVAQLLNLSAGYISRIERGSSNPSKEVLDNLCKIYEVDMIEELGDDGEIDLSSLRKGTDIVDILSLEDITYRGESIGIQDRINIATMVKTLLEIEDYQSKNNFINIINNVSEMTLRK